MQLSAPEATLRDEKRPAPGALATIGLALVPLALLAGVLVLIAQVGFPGASPDALPVEDVAFERLVVEEGAFRATLRNVGPEEAEIAQVFVNDMLVAWTLEPAGAIPRLRTATLVVPFDWVEGEPYEIAVLTTNSIKFTGGTEAAFASPQPDAKSFGVLALLGLYVGAIPVLLGLLWRPLLARAKETTLNVALGITVGLLLFLAADALVEGLEISDLLPGPLGGPFLLVAGALGAFALLEVAGRRSGRAGTPLALATLVALGIGLHNLAEGLAIGGAFALGEVALGAFLVVGFAVHNTTEGLAIVAPVARERVRIATLVGLGLLAGLPVILGAWIGGFAPSPILAVVFLGVGAGAIAQVALAIDRATGGAMRRGAGLAGVALGAAVMFVTSLFVVI